MSTFSAHRTLHEAYQFLSWKYSRLRDITSKNPDPKIAEAEDAIEPFREVKIDEEDEGEFDAEASRPKTATTTAAPDKRRRRAKSAKGSYAGRGGGVQKAVEPIVEVTQEGVEGGDASDANQKNNEEEVSASGSGSGSKRTEEETIAEEQPPEKKVELENENMEDYLERMARLISRMVADQMNENWKKLFVTFRNDLLTSWISKLTENVLIDKFVFKGCIFDWVKDISIRVFDFIAQIYFAIEASRNK